MCAIDEGSLVSSIAEWLLSLGMAQYTKRFAEDDIDLDVLAELTDQDFDRLGVSLGHRRRMLKALRELAAPPQVATAAPVAPQHSAERRQVTVMFCDLVGSTALSSKLDPEDLRGIIGLYHRCCTELIERGGGFVAKYMGDGVLAYFGYPQAHEDDAERAVRAGLALVDAVPRLETATAEISLQVRIGIATGLVVVGDLIGSGEAQERGIVGETPNLAARLQGIAEPNMVVIAEGTRRLLGNLFELHDLGAKDLKGIAEPAHAWAALRASTVVSRFEALHAAGLTALVGRQEESELLLRRWSRAKTGEGQVMLLSGEAGIGKSRLTAALLEHLAAEPHTRLRYFCSPQHTDSALYPIIVQMERAAGLTREDTPQARLDKLDAILAQTSTSIEDATLFAEMLSFANDGRYPTLALSPQQRRQRTLDALLSRIEALTRPSPVLIILEDAQWIDPTSLEAFGRLVHRIAPLRVLLIVTFRLEFDPPWLGQPHVTTMTINRLARREVGDMIDRVVGNKLLPTSIRQDIIERTDGIPLFVEEMTKAVLEAESESEAQQTIAAVPSPALAVPASLHASLMARLDRLGPAREVAQIGAAIGREFSHALLGAVISKPEADLGSALERLIDAGLLFRQGVPPHTTYLFKHALIQEAAYGTLLREPRRALHARIAETLEGRFADIAETQPELPAHHYTEAKQPEKASLLWQKAGGLALQRVALIEAIAHLNKGMDLIAALSPSVERDGRELDLRTLLGPAWMALKGWAAQEVWDSLFPALGLANSLRRRAALLPILWGLIIHVVCRGRVAESLRWVTQAMNAAETSGDPNLLIVGHHAAGAAYYWLGDLIKVQGHSDRVLALYNEERHAHLAVVLNNEPKTAALVDSAEATWMLGYPERAVRLCDAALEEARRRRRPFNLGWALTKGAQVLDYLREPDELLKRVTEADRVGRENNLPILTQFLVPIVSGIGLIRRGQAAEGTALLERGISVWEQSGGRVGIPCFKSVLAEGMAQAGDLAGALVLIDEVIAQIERPGWEERHYYAEALRIKAWLLTLKSDAEGAERAYIASLDWARKQQAKSWELRTATSYARLMSDQGRIREAYDLLEPIYGWFTEGFGTTDLKEAKALLDQLT